MKKNRFKIENIEIYYKDGRVDIFPWSLWNDYEYNGKVFILKDHGTWIAIYNMDELTSVIVNRKKVD